MKVNDLIQLLKLPLSIQSAVSLALGLVLFLPNEVLLRVGLNDIQNPWRMLIGFIFFISISLLSVNLLKNTPKNLRSVYNRVKISKTIANLSTREKQILAVLYTAESYTSFLPSSDGVTLRLNSKSLIQRVPYSGYRYGRYLSVPYTITHIAQKHIDKDPEFITEFNHNELQELYSQLNNLNFL